MNGIIFMAKLAILFKKVYICQLNDCASWRWNNAYEKVFGLTLSFLFLYSP